MWDALARHLRRSGTAGLLLLAVYGALSLLMSPRGYLGTDTGAKVATLEVMSQRSTFDPDVGYWAEDLDPDGEVHPLYQAQPTEDGGWVAVSTLPALLVARPLYDLGGYRATLLVPMAGAVGAAFAARAVARRLAGDDDGWRVFWVVGLASPMVIYALDFWEHTIGVALMVAAAALLLDVTGGRGASRAAAGGALFGAAAALRTESFVYAMVLVAIALGVRFARERRSVDSLVLGAAAVAGFAVPWFANAALEDAVAAPSRGARAASTAAEVGGDLGQRVREGLQTSVGLNAGDVALSALPGVAIVAVVIVAIRAGQRGDRRFAVTALAAVATVLVVDAIGGLGFVPGLFIALPLAIAALAIRPAEAPARQLLVGALLVLPIVYLVQYTGGAAPQWGGRYTLTSSILLGTLGVVGLRRTQPWLLRSLVALSVVVTGLGVAWLNVRSHGVEQFFDDVVAQSEPVLISRNAFLLREGGPVAVGRRWLSVDDEDSFRRAIAVVEQTGERRFSVLEWGAAAPPAASLPDGVREVTRELLTFVDVPVGLVTYELLAPSG